MRHPHVFDRYDADDADDDSRRPEPKCKRCGSTDVRWRMQGGRWVLFSLRPGVEHRCDVTDAFEAVSS
jgi:hypothetical protein